MHLHIAYWLTLPPPQFNVDKFASCTTELSDQSCGQNTYKEICYKEIEWGRGQKPPINITEYLSQHILSMIVAQAQEAQEGEY